MHYFFKGDVGGALAVNYNGIYYVAGIVSKVLTCNLIQPTVFSNVYTSAEWIQKTIDSGVVPPLQWHINQYEAG